MSTHFTIRSPIMTDAVWCTPTCGINYSVSHHDGCCLVHPDMWYHLFGHPSRRMLFGAPRHVVSLIRSPIMTNVVWCTLTCGITYSVSHHDGCSLVHTDMWYQLNAIRHHDGCRLVHPAKWEHFFNAMHHHDGCRLVHPAKWDIGKFRGAFVTDAVWFIPPGGLFDISTNSHL